MTWSGIVINTAGILRFPSFIDAEQDDWIAVLDVHFNGYLNVLAEALPIMAGRFVVATRACPVDHEAGRRGLIRCGAAPGPGAVPCSAPVPPAPFARLIPVLRLIRGPG